MTETAAVSRHRVLGSLVACLLACSNACQREGTTDEHPGASPSVPSPNARMLPAPLASLRGSMSEPLSEEGDGLQTSSTLVPSALPPQPFPVHGEISGEPPFPRDGSVLELRAEFLWPEVEARTISASSEEAPPGEEKRGDAPALATRPELRLFLSQRAQLQLLFDSPSFALPVGTQLRARADRWGHVVVWPDRRSYRVAPRGSLRALLNERRVDVSPLLPGSIKPAAPGRRLGLSTVRREIEAPLGTLTLESAPGASPGGGGILICRFLLELARLQSSNELCGSNDLPLEAHYVWSRGGELTFRVTSLQRHGSWPASLPPDAFDVPPVMPIFKPGELPPDPSPLLWPLEVRRELWGSEDEVYSELLLTNPQELPIYAIVDRFPLARVPALGALRWRSGKRLRQVAFRDFLGEQIHAARPVEVPGSLTLGPQPEPTSESEPTAAQR